MKKVFKYLFFILLLILGVSYFMGLFGVGDYKESDSRLGKFVEVSNQKIRYLEKGEGPDVLLIHGTPGSIEDMVPLLDSLAKDHHVIAFDRPGHGYSSANDIPRNIEHNVTMAKAMIVQFELDEVLVIGHSYGGCIAMAMATEENSRVKEYYVLGSPLFSFQYENIYKLFNIPILKTSLSWLLSKGYAQSKIGAELPDRFGPNQHLADSRFISLRQNLWSQPKVILSKSIETLNIEKDFKTLIPKYKDLKTKVNVVVGLDDVPYYTEDLKQNMPLENLEAEFWKNTGHFVQLEQLERLLALIRKNEYKTISLENDLIVPQE